METSLVMNRQGFNGVRMLCVFLLVLAIWTGSGCSGYRFGNGTIFRPDVRSVHVPIFENDSLRRHLGQRLTEAVVREIQSRTPYVIASPTTTDTILRGRITSDRKHVLGENQFDEPRELQIDLAVEATWTTVDGTPLMQRFVLKVNESEAFVPEGGQSMVSAQQELIDDIAAQIVNQMEAGW